MENPEFIETLELDAALIDVKQDQTEVNTQEFKSSPWFVRALAWLAVPIPAYAVVAVVAVLTPVIASQLSTRPSGQIELAAFSSSATRGGSQNTANEFDVVTDLSKLTDNSAIMVKVTPNVKEVYRLEVYDFSKTESQVIWTSSPFEVKSGTRDQVVFLPNSVRVANARIRLLGKGLDGSFTAVRFCHYSEVCR